jgi:hypothetical protein
MSFEAGEVSMREIKALATSPKECLLSSFSVYSPMGNVLQNLG